MGAVFFITKRVHNDKTYHRRASHEGIFIGQTEDLSGSLAIQSQLDRFTKHGANCVCIHAVANAEQRIAATQDLLAGNSTSCND